MSRIGRFIFVNNLATMACELTYELRQVNMYLYYESKLSIIDANSSSKILLTHVKFTHFWVIIENIFKICDNLKLDQSTGALLIRLICVSLVDLFVNHTDDHDNGRSFWCIFTQTINNIFARIVYFS